ncbi:glycosyltransferase family 39 protein [Myxococcota bacterium]|nr:glycosyltransferase family 39 protein [Myxococcota bacterium]MBU1381817.1 glycosyltransferase family 39 protein [Myxococcota bacterium]MBU1498594.1 glycosyltransferase family 39 protein [Myxococcota bacterium]
MNSPVSGYRISSKTTLIVGGIIFFVFTLFNLRGLKEPFLTGHAGFNGALRSTIATNYNRYGFIKTGLLPFKNTGPFDFNNRDKEGIVHWHHPPLINILTAISFRLFGNSEASARFFPILAAMATFWLLFFWLHHKYGPWASLAGVFFLTIIPMQTTFGNMINYEGVIIALTLIALVAWEIRDKYPKLIGFIFVLSFLAAGFTDWPGFILAGVTGIFMLFESRRNWKIVLVTGICMTALLVFLFFWLSAWAEHDGLAGLARYRAGMGSIKVTYGQLLERTMYRLRDYYGFFIISGGLIWIIGKLLIFRSVDKIVAVFGISTVIYFSAFKAGAHIHVFFLHYATCAIIVAAAAGFASLMNTLDKLLSNISGGELTNLYIEKIRRTLFILTPALIAFLIFSWNMPLIEKTLRESRGISYKKPSFVPNAGRQDIVIIGKFLKYISNPRDVIVFHRSSHSSPQLRYYTGRNYRYVHHRDPKSVNGSFFVIPQRLLSDHHQSLFASKYPVHRILRYLVYDLRKGRRKSVSAWDFRISALSYFEQWFSGSVPPASFFRNVNSSAEYEKLLKNNSKN